jgi:hypothetical protein
MKATILLNHTDNTRQVEEEEKTRFLRSILEQMGVPIQDFWTDEVIISVDQKIRLRDLISSFGILVLDDQDGRMQIYVEGEKVASWDKPTYKLKSDLSQLDRKKRLFLEMTIECNSLFDSVTESEQNSE